MRKFVHPDIALPEDCDVETTIIQRTVDYRKVLHYLESGDEEWKKLWDITKVWRLDCFKEIYSLLGCRFDHDFTESEVQNHR